MFCNPVPTARVYFLTLDNMTRKGVTVMGSDHNHNPCNKEPDLLRAPTIIIQQCRQNLGVNLMT